MKYEYDPEANGIFILFFDELEKERDMLSQEFWPEELNEEIGLLFDKNGKLMRLKMLPTSKYMYDSFLKK